MLCPPLLALLVSALIALHALITSTKETDGAVLDVAWFDRTQAGGIEGQDARGHIVSPWSTHGEGQEGKDLR